MIILTTQKLYFNKYPYMICVTASNIVIPAQPKTIYKLCMDFLKSNNIEFRLRRDTFLDRMKNIREINFSIYLLNKNDYELACSNFIMYITKTSEPANTDCENFLKSNNVTTLLRKTLLYKKFRFVVHFIPMYNDLDNRLELRKNVKDIFADREYNINYKMRFTPLRKWTTDTLYLVDYDDLILVKLTLDEYIKNVVQIKLVDEI